MSEELKVRLVRDKISEREIESKKADGMKYVRNGEKEYKEIIWKNNKDDDLFFYDIVRRETLKELIKIAHKPRTWYSICLCSNCKEISREKRCPDSYCENCRNNIFNLMEWLEKELKP